MTGALLQLLLIAFGILMIVGGPRAVGWTVSAIFAPIQWILRMAIGIAVLAMLATVLLPQMAQHLPALISRKVQETFSGAMTQNAPIIPQPQGILLDYPILAQMDLSLYRPRSLADTLEYPEEKPVRNLACLATVYLMIERQRGNPTAMLDESRWTLGIGARHPNYVERVGTPFSLAAVIEELDNSRPVILEAPAKPGKLPHFVLAVGWRQQTTFGVEILINDPWRGERIALPATENQILDSASDHTFTKMRKISN